MSVLPRHFLLVMSNCKDPEREDDLGRWYEETHVPDVLETPGIVRATRYQLGSRPRERQAQFLTAYELDTDDFRQVSNDMRAVLARTQEAGRQTDLIESFSVGFYTLAGEHFPTDGTASS